MLKSRLCDHSDANMLIKGTTAVAQKTPAAPNNASKKITFASFTSCISRINNTQIDDTQYTDVIMAIYILKEYSANY